MTSKTQISIWHEPSNTLLARGPRGWGITPFEGNFYISRKYLADAEFRNTLIPGLCMYKGLYHWLDLKLHDGKREAMLAWRYIVPNPLFPFIWFRIALPAHHPALRVEGQ